MSIDSIKLWNSKGEAFRAEFSRTPFECRLIGLDTVYLWQRGVEETYYWIADSGENVPFDAFQEWIKARVYSFGEYENILVPAKRHVNPDGSVGGWVAETASVSRTVHVGPKAEVYGTAKVRDCVQLKDEAQVYGNCRVMDEVVIEKNGRVYGDACVMGRAKLTGFVTVYEHAVVKDEVELKWISRISGHAVIEGSGVLKSGQYDEGSINLSLAE